MQTALCSVYGCIDYMRVHECQCNAPCTGFNDCCPDYFDECANSKNTDAVIVDDNSTNNIVTNYGQNNIIFASVVMIAILILMIITIIQYVFMMKKKENRIIITTTTDNRMIIIGTFISITFYFVCCLCYLIGSAALFIEDNLQKKANSELTSIIFWSVGFAVMQFVLGGRLYFTFQNTPYSYPKSVFILLSIIFIIATSSMIAFEVEFSSHDWHNPTLMVTTLVGFTCHIMFLFLVMTLYIAAFFKITLNRSVSLLRNESIVNSERNDKMKLLMDHTTKITLLTGIVGIVTICAFVIWCIFFAKEDQMEGGQSVSFLFLNAVWWLLPLDALINAICLFLQLPFTFTYNIYSKLCCCCHGICVSICISITTSLVGEGDVENEVNQHNELTTMHGNDENQPKI
eukprot:482307_1